MKFTISDNPKITTILNEMFFLLIREKRIPTAPISLTIFTIVVLNESTNGTKAVTTNIMELR